MAKKRKKNILKLEGDFEGDLEPNERGLVRFA